MYPKKEGEKKSGERERKMVKAFLFSGRSKSSKIIFSATDKLADNKIAHNPAAEKGIERGERIIIKPPFF